MKTTTVEAMISFVFKYIWLLFILILGIESITTFTTANTLIMKTTQDIMSATKNEIENKVDITWKLAEALSQDTTLTDDSIDMIERGRLLKPYAKVYNLFLIGLTDAEGVIVSSYDDIPGNIGHKEYFQRVVATGIPEVTDAFFAGADSTVKNYTICMPIFDTDHKVKGTIIMSIFYDELNSIATRTLNDRSFRFSLMDSQNNIMSDQNESLIGMSFLEAEANSLILGRKAGDINRDIAEKKTGSYWVISNGRLEFIRYAPIKNTNWSMNVQTDVLRNLSGVFIQYLLKIAFYIVLFLFIVIFGKWYTMNRFKTVNTLIKQITTLQCELQAQRIFENGEMSDFIKISQKGLFDELTNLPTRFVFLHQLGMTFNLADKTQHFALLSADLDHLKQINDQYGHVLGDLALQHMGEQFIALSQVNESLVCRYGGDEFLACVPFDTKAEIMQILEDLIKKLHTTVAWQGADIEIHASMGVAFFPEHGSCFEPLFEHADLALYKAKQHDRSGYQIYAPNEELSQL